MTASARNDTQHANSGTQRWLSSSSETRNILWWYTTNLAAICTFKLIHFEFVYRQGFFAAAAIQTNAPVEAAIRAALIFTTDVLQVGAIVLAVFLIATRLLAMSFNVLILFVTLLVFLTGIANVLSLQELGTPIRVDTLRLSIDWIRTDPSIISEYIGRRNILGAAIITGWLSLPFIMTTLDRNNGDASQLRRRFWTNAYRIVVTFIILGTAAFAYRIFSLDGRWILGLSIIAAVLMPRYLPFGARLRYVSTATRRIVIGAALLAFVGSGAFQLSQKIRGLGPSAAMFDGYVVTVMRSLLSAATTSSEDQQAVSIEKLRSMYDALVYPEHNGSPPHNIIDLDPATLVPRHIIVISLETAPMRYYQLFDDPSLPNFYRLSQTAIVNEHHYTNTPFTTSAAASISSGLYELRTDPEGGFPAYALPRVLGNHGFRTSYVDSFLIDWRPGQSNHRRLYESLGFQSLVDASEIPGFEQGNTTFEYETRLEIEAIARVVSKVVEAEAAREKAMVFLTTGLGHFPWNTPESLADQSAEEKLDGLVREYDKIIGLLIERLDVAGLTDDAIIVITGDHGLRYNSEFKSVGLQIAHSNVAFNVPLIISASGLLERQVRVPFVTSHVDVTPTLLSMLGISADGMFHHGADILSGKPANRVTYMMNTRLSPVDGLHWNGFFLTYDALREITEIASDPSRSDSQPINPALPEHQLVPETFVQLRDHLAQARRLFDLTIASVYVAPESDAEHTSH